MSFFDVFKNLNEYEVQDRKKSWMQDKISRAFVKICPRLTTKVKHWEENMNIKNTKKL